jgi:predicted permease
MPVLADSENTDSIHVSGYSPQENEHTYVEENWIGPDFFAAMKIPLIGGREFNDADSAASRKVAIVNQTLARHYFPGKEAIGGHFTLNYAARKGHGDYEIVGVVQDSKNDTPRAPIQPFVYLPYAQLDTLGGATFYVRTEQEPQALGPVLTRAVARLDSSLPVFNMKTLVEQVNESMIVERVMATLTSCFAFLASLLAAIGLYGVMAYVVARRTREIGIRIALGASRAHIGGMVLRESALLAFWGVVIGLMLTLLVGRLVNSMLFGVSAANPLVLGLTAALLAGFALLAGGLPARAAAKVDPMTALRYE